MTLVVMTPMRTVAAVASLGVLAACASPTQVHTLATGRADVSAYALQGQDLVQLRRTAQQLCPMGGEIVRQSAQGQRPEPVDGRWRKALQATTQWFDPPLHTAQLLLLCHESGDRMRLPPTPPAMTVKAAASAPESTAALPVGPIVPEW